MKSSYWLKNARLEIGFEKEDKKVIGTATELFHLFICQILSSAIII